MATELTEVKPCPWCGKQPWLVPFGLMPKETKGWQVGCEYSGCPVNPSADAETAWYATLKWENRKEG